MKALLSVPLEPLRLELEVLFNTDSSKLIFHCEKTWVQLTPEPKMPAGEERYPHVHRNMSQEPKAAWQAPLSPTAPPRAEPRPSSWQGCTGTDEPVHLLGPSLSQASSQR